MRRRSIQISFFFFFFSSFFHYSTEGRRIRPSISIRPQTKNISPVSLNTYNSSIVFAYIFPFLPLLWRCRLELLCLQICQISQYVKSKTYRIRDKVWCSSSFPSIGALPLGRGFCLSNKEWKNFERNLNFFICSFIPNQSYENNKKSE